MTSLPEEIAGYLNSGYSVAAEVPISGDGLRCFVRIKPVPKPGVPRDERRYLNSRYSMWEYWDFSFRRMVLRHGWESNEFDYDLYLTQDERLTTSDESDFAALLSIWISDNGLLHHIQDSECPE